MTPGPGVPYFGAEVDEAVLISDGIEPIVAYRAWQLDADGTIRSFHWLCDEVWSTSEWVGAWCIRYGIPDTDQPLHEVPAEGCRCGIYAWKRQEDVREIIPPNPFLPSGQSFGPLYASGVVELRGKVIEHRVRLQGRVGQDRWSPADIPVHGEAVATIREALGLGSMAGLARRRVSGWIMTAIKLPADGWSEDEGAVRIPDGTTPIIGYRIWQVRADGRILSLNHTNGWGVGAWTEARCFAKHRGSDLDFRPLHRAPAEGCTCGFHALKTARQASQMLQQWGYLAFPPEVTYASGLVELAGKVIEHMDGFRGERARIVTILPVQWRPLCPTKAAIEALGAPGHSVHPASSRAAVPTTPVEPRPPGWKRLPEWMRNNAAGIVVVVLKALSFGLVYWFAQWRHGM